MDAKVMFHIRQQPWGLIAGRLDDCTVETHKRLLHESIPGVLIPCQCRLL